MDILITGSSGFVGKNLLRYLDNDYSIRCVSREKLRNTFSVNLKQVDTVIHLAGKAHDLKRISNSDDYYKVNYELTRDVYNAFLMSKARKFIFISSVKAVRDFTDEILDEDVIPNPQTHYGKSKLMAEEYIQSQPLPHGKSYYILRPCMIHGPGNKGNLNLLYNFVQKGIPYPLAAFDNKRSFLSIKNLCFVIKELINKNAPSGIYNVSDDEALSTNEVVSILSRSLNKKPNLWRVPSNLIRLVARIGDKIKLPLNTDRLNKLTESYQVSNCKIKNALDIEFPLSAKEGLQLTALSFQQGKNDVSIINERL